MFQDLDDTLKKVLDEPAIPAALTKLKDADKSFLTPDKNFPAQLQNPTVSLFLYDVKENLQLRDPEPITEKVNGFYKQRPSPLRVDCSYLVTTWETQAGAVNVADEHLLLAQALLWLSRFPTIPANYLQGSLANQLYPPPTLVAQMDGQKGISEFWLALGIAPRPSFHLVVTIAMDLLLQEEGSLVTKRISDVGRLDEIGTTESGLQFGGQVLKGLPPKPADGAWVELADAGGSRINTTMTDTDGRYDFNKLLRGTYKVRARAEGFAEASRNVEVPSTTDDYNLHLN
jgi:hypothetical protein